MDVTATVNRGELLIGGSDYTGQHSQAASQSLHLIDGPTLQRPNQQIIGVLPTAQRWEDAVGLWGAENKFIRYDLKYNKKWALKCYEDDGYECVKFNPLEEEKDEGYDAQEAGREGEVDPYEEARVQLFAFPEFPGEQVYISVELIDNKTGNIYNDAHVDCRLYTKDRMEHPYNKGYIRPNEWFYVGFHARNTRRLPLDITVVVGNEYKPQSIINERFIMRPLSA